MHRAGISGKCTSCWLADAGAIERQLVTDDGPAWKRYARIALWCALAILGPTLILMAAQLLDRAVGR